MYWFCECQSWRLGDDGLQWIAWGRAVSCLHNQAPNLNTMTSCGWNTLTSGTVTLLRVLILWVPEQHNWGRDGLQMNCWGRAVSCLHNQAPNLNTIDSLWWNTLTSGTVDITTCIWFCECQSSTTGGRMVSNELCEGRQVSCLHNQAPNWNTIDSCEGYTDIRYSDITTCIDSVRCQSSTTGGRMVSKWIVWGRAVSCLHNQAPNWKHNWLLWWNTLTSGTVTLLRVLILWVPSWRNWGRMVYKWNCVRESSLMLT